MSVLPVFCTAAVECPIGCAVLSTVQPVASRYTDWAIQAQEITVFFIKLFNTFSCIFVQFEHHLQNATYAPTPIEETLKFLPTHQP
jgi:hypothetical protein